MDFYRRILRQANAPPLFQETVSPQAFATALIPSGHIPWLHQQPPRPDLAAEPTSTIPFSSLLMAAGHQVHNAEQHTLSQQEQRRAQQYGGLQAQEAELDKQVQQLIQMKWQLHGQQAALQLSAGGQAVVAAGARTQTADNPASSPQESEKKLLMKAKTHCAAPSSVTSNPEEKIEAPSSLPPLKKRPQRFLPPSEDEGGKHEPKQKKQKRSTVKKGSSKKLPSASVVTKAHIVYDTTDKDVLSVPSRGRGYDPPGNQAFHALCKEFHDFFMQAQSKLEKTAVVSFLVDKIQSEGGRFLRRNDRKDDIQEAVSWVELSKEEAGQKTRDVLIRLCSKKR